MTTERACTEPFAADMEQENASNEPNVAQNATCQNVPVDRAENTPEATSGASPVHKKVKDCVFWERGSCDKGDECPFRHDPAKFGTVTKDKIICKYFLVGHCTKGKDCPFSHQVCPRTKQVTGCCPCSGSTTQPHNINRLHWGKQRKLWRSFKSQRKQRRAGTFLLAIARLGTSASFCTYDTSKYQHQRKTSMHQRKTELLGAEPPKF